MDQRDCRDALQCYMTEQISHECAITVDLRAQLEETDQHMTANMNSLGSRPKHKQFFEHVEGKLDEVFLDYFWFLESCVNTNVTMSFYKDTLPYIASKSLHNKGVIWLLLTVETFCGFF